jgi:hypothetical protein
MSCKLPPEIALATHSSENTVCALAMKDLHLLVGIVSSIFIMKIL